jgi:glycosyltransferase involved in cell wall biosynthesis
MICSVCIATYKRPQLLRNLLDSLFIQNLPANVDLQLIVVDNDKNKSAENILKEYSNTERIKLEYYVQPQKNISLTRNVAVKNSNGEYLLFIDDDEEADKNWIMNYIDVLKRYKADGVFGPVLPVFHNGTPEWMKQSSLFNKECPPTGDEAVFTRTSNCIVKAKIVKSEDGPFDIDYGITGGEDSHLFTRLKRKGAKFISSREAIVTEHVPPERTQIKWLIKKAFQTGNTVTRRMIGNAQNKIKRKLELLLRAVTFAVISLVLVLIYFPIKKKRVEWLMKLSSNVGHIVAVFGYNFKAYK